MKEIRPSNPQSATPAEAAGDVSARPEPAAPKYLNREISWLNFNQRVLEEALGEHNPLMERLNFLAITGNNLDEFFMKRVGGLQRQLAAGVTKKSMDGMTPANQLTMIRERVLEVYRVQAHLLLEDLFPAMTKAGLKVLAWDDLNPAQRDWLKTHFEQSILPILTPLGVGRGQPFPFISNLSLSLAVLVRAPGEHHERFARVKIPSNRPRWIRLPGSEPTFIAQEEIIAQFIGRLFVGMEIIETQPFRVTRNADLERNEEEADDLLDVIEEELRNRRFAPIVRLETTNTISDELLGWLVRELEIDPERDVYRTPAPLGLSALHALAQEPLHDGFFPPHAPVTHPRLRQLELNPQEKNIFDIIRQGDILLHHPYDAFSTSVLALIQAAANDPQVLAIKQTLYRTAQNSPIVMALLQACENGKEVNVQVEIKARFDEANNIEWVRTLERAGAHVTYGFIGLKTHSKTILIVRDEPDGIRRYAHIGTGNYHTGTARLYTDLGLLTCQPDLCQDVADLFNYLTGHSSFKNYKKLLVAPVNMRERFLGMIRREIAMHSAEHPGHIQAKMNQLEDPQIIEALYEASKAGVKIDLIVRGFCCLKPGAPGLSENIRIMSVIGRFLEHSRIYIFHNGGNPEYYIGSADWMSRNLDWRVEAIAPIENPALRKYMQMIYDTTWNDQAQAWDLLPDGRYVRRRPRRGKGSQHTFIERTQRGAKTGK
ncbi:polyphosphate kinase 1 [bacterium]|nr:polyphosphate kinase 1 [bacterium]